MKTRDRLHPSIPTLSFHDPFSDYLKKHTRMIHPAFPNWEKSFVSGKNSPLFQVEHRIDLKNSSLLFTEIQFKKAAEGPPDHVHGGATAGLVDEMLGIVLWHNEFKSMTKTLQLFYWKAVPLKETMYGVTEIVKPGPRTLEVRSTIFNKEKTAYVSAQAVFYHLTPEQYAKFNFQPVP